MWTHTHKHTLHITSVHKVLSIYPDDRHLLLARRFVHKHSLSLQIKPDFLPFVHLVQSVQEGQRHHARPKKQNKPGHMSTSLM